MQDHHRKQRKKQVQKNKEQRLKARDERVLTTKSVSSVQEDIKKLKFRKHLQHTEKQKLQRMEKELKILKEAQSKEPKSHWKPQRNHDSAPKLDDPRKSVYFDARFNPYGAPPPGKPRLYHRWGGGVTMNMNEAIVPGEEPPPQPQQDNHRQANDHRGSHHSRENSSRDQRSPTPPRNETNPQSTTIREDEAKDGNSNEKNKPLIVPSLPPPSKAVERGRRGKVNADIWASNEEVDYELRANQVDLEADNIGEVKKKAKKKKKKKPPLEFYYKDMSGQVQGPFQKAQMREWMNAGFFPPSTMVKTSRKETWLLVGEVQALEELPAPSASANEPSVSDRIAALKGENSMQDRIAALKGETSMQDRIAALKGHVEADGEQDDTGNDGEVPAEFEDRIAALRKSLAAKTSQGVNDVEPTSHEPAPMYSAPHDVHEEEQEDTSTVPQDDVNDGNQAAGPASPPPDDVYDGEQAVGPAYPPPDDVYGGEQAVPGPAHPPPDNVYDEEQAGGPAYPHPDDVYEEEQVVGPAYPPSDDVYEEVQAVGPAYAQPDDVPAYPLDEQGVAPYPVDEGYGEGPGQGPAPYPVDDGTSAVAPYPAVDDYPASDPYPATDAYPIDMAYPVNDTYPVSEGDLAYPATDAYPASEPYPTVDESGSIQGPQLGPPMEPPKKTIKVDKAVVAFLPTRLRNAKRKPAATGSEAAPKRTKVEVKHDKNSGDDDLDKFMDEIDGL